MAFRGLFTLSSILVLLIGFAGQVLVLGVLPDANTAIIKVNPENPSGNVGSRFTIYVELSNVTALYGLDVQLSWNPSIIRYVDHCKTIPVESYVRGILHGPTVSLRDDIDENASMPGSGPGAMYWLAEASLYPAALFTGDGSLFAMTFEVLEAQACDIHFIAVTLANVNGEPIECAQFDGHFLGTPVEHDVSVQLDIPEKAWINELALLNVTLFNNGLYAESMVELKLLVDDIVVNETIVESLAAGSSYLMRSVWVPVTLGDHVVEACAPLVPGENQTVDNIVIRNLNVVANVPDITVLLETPLCVVVGLVTNIEVQVGNIGENDALDVYVQLAINGSIVHLIDTGCLAVGTTHIFNYSWAPSSSGKYNFTAVALPTQGELFTGNNNMTRLIFALEIPSGHTGVFMILPEGEVKVGDVFTVGVAIADAYDLYGLDIQFSWDPTIVQYMRHGKMIPVEEHPGGVLHAPAIPVKNDVDESASLPGSEPGTRYWLAEASLLPAAVFYGPGIIFTIAFKALRHGDPQLTVTGLCLSDTTGGPRPVSVEAGTMTILARGQGDVNDDGLVDVLDLVQAAGAYYAVEGEPDWNQFADLASPWKLIDILDLVTISSYYGKEYY